MMKINDIIDKIKSGNQNSILNDDNSILNDDNSVTSELNSYVVDYPFDDAAVEELRIAYLKAKDILDSRVDEQLSVSTELDLFLNSGFNPASREDRNKLKNLGDELVELKGEIQKLVLAEKTAKNNLDLAIEQNKNYYENVAVFRSEEERKDSITDANLDSIATKSISSTVNIVIISIVLLAGAYIAKKNFL